MISFILQIKKHIVYIICRYSIFLLFIEIGIHIQFGKMWVALNVSSTYPKPHRKFISTPFADKPNSGHFISKSMHV